MKKLILATALTLALTACTQPPQETVSTEPDVTVHAVGGEDLSTEVSSVESDSSPNYRDEGSTSSDVPFVRNHFNVQRELKKRLDSVKELLAGRDGTIEEFTVEFTIKGGKYKSIKHSGRYDD